MTKISNIRIVLPADGKETEVETILLRGIVDDPTVPVVLINFNGEVIELPVTDRIFSTILTLVSGRNRILGMVPPLEGTNRCVYGFITDEESEQPMGEVPVYLKNGEEILQQSITDYDGYYFFCEVPSSNDLSLLITP